jgi:hypothetical protein
VAVLSGLIGSGTLVWSASNAAFSGTTVNPNDTWAAGAVSLTDDDSNSAMFSASGLTPASSPLVKCIVVTYGGSVSAPVKLYGAVPTGTGLGAYLNLTVEIGTVGAFVAGCGAFSGATIFSGTIAAFATHTDWASGVDSTWTPTAATQNRVFRFTVTVANDPLGNGLTCTMPFTWEAQAA